MLGCTSGRSLHMRSAEGRPSRKDARGLVVVVSLSNRPSNRLTNGVSPCHSSLRAPMQSGCGNLHGLRIANKMSSRCHDFEECRGASLLCWGSRGTP